MQFSIEIISIRIMCRRNLNVTFYKRDKNALIFRTNDNIRLRLKDYKKYVLRNIYIYIYIYIYINTLNVK